MSQERLRYDEEELPEDPPRQEFRESVGEVMKPPVPCAENSTDGMTRLDSRIDYWAALYSDAVLGLWNNRRSKNPSDNKPVLLFSVPNWPKEIQKSKFILFGVVQPVLIRTLKLSNVNININIRSNVKCSSYITWMSDHPRIETWCQHQPSHSLFRHGKILVVLSCKESNDKLL